MAQLLHAALLKGDADRTESLLSSQKDGDVRSLLLHLSPRGQSVLHAAVQGGDEAALRVLLPFVRPLLPHPTLSPHLRDKDGQTPLLLAVSLGYEGISTALLDELQSEHRDESLLEGPEGRSALHAAVTAQTPRLLRRLAGIAPSLLRHADRQGDGLTPLLLAVTTSNHRAVEALLNESGDHPAADRDPLGRTALHLAAAAGDADSIGLLVEAARRLGLRGASFVDAADSDGRTALHVAYATFRGNAGLIARRLVEAGADPELRDRSGLRPTEVAAQMEREEAEAAEAAKLDAEFSTAERRERQAVRRQARQLCDEQVSAWLADHGLEHLEDLFGRRRVVAADVERLAEPGRLGKLGVPVEDRPRVLEAVRAESARREEVRLEEEKARERAEAGLPSEEELQSQRRTRWVAGGVLLVFFVAVYFFLRFIESRGPR